MLRTKHIVDRPAGLLRRWLAHPLTAGLQLDDPVTTELRKEIIFSKPFLKAIYDEWYRIIAAGLPLVDGTVVELGSGAGHGNNFIPRLVTSEVFLCSTVQLVANAQQLPFRDASLRAIIFTDVMHHLTDVRCFFAEASRCLRKGGRVLMIEPWVTTWSRFIYTTFHHEAFCPESEEWSAPCTGPLSGANGAIPWIVFVRDRQKFESEFPLLTISQIQPFLPFRYLLSGGIAMRTLMPGFSHMLWAKLEELLKSRMHSLAMFAFVSLQRL